MIFHYLKELKPHLNLIGFLTFCTYIVLLVLIHMVTGSFADSGPDPVMPASPIAVSSPAVERGSPTSPRTLVQSGEENPPIQVPNQDCLDVEGSTICLE